MPDRATADGSAPPANGGLLGAIRGLADVLLAAAHQRLELFALELREEKLRAVQLLIWLSVAVFAGALALVFASVTIVYLFWETARLPALVGLTLAYLFGSVAAAWAVRRCLKRRPKPFEASLAELRSDRACIPSPPWTN